MMMLLQCPRFLRSPSRNQTPPTIFVTVSGLASEFPAKKASEASAPNTARIHTRALLIVPPTEHQCTFKLVANAMVKSILLGESMAATPRRSTPVVDIAGVKLGG